LCFHTERRTHHLKDYLVDDDKSTFSSSADSICAMATIMAGAFISDLEWSCPKLEKASIKVMWIYPSKTCEISQRTQFWPPFLIKARSCTAG